MYALFMTITPSQRVVAQERQDRIAKTLHPSLARLTFGLLEKDKLKRNYSMHANKTLLTIAPYCFEGLLRADWMAMLLDTIELSNLTFCRRPLDVFEPALSQTLCTLVKNLIDSAKKVFFITFLSFCPKS
jgi:hypothetical protein